MPNFFAIFIQFLIIISCMVSYIYNADDKENADDDVKVMYTGLSCTLAVATSAAVIGNVRRPVVDVRYVDYIRKPIPLWYDYNPTERLYRYQNKALLLSSLMIYAIDDPLL